MESDGIQIRPVSIDEAGLILEVYHECEDFLALGPVAHASLEMVAADLALSNEQGGIFCGIFLPSRVMVGVVDYIPDNFEGDPQTAFLELLMIASAFRRRGLGAVVVRLVEEIIRQNPRITRIGVGVQVNNPTAIAFWQKMGYGIISEPELMADGTTVVRLEKPVVPASFSSLPIRQ